MLAVLAFIKKSQKNLLLMNGQGQSSCGRIDEHTVCKAKQIFLRGHFKKIAGGRFGDLHLQQLFLFPNRQAVTKTFVVAHSKNSTAFLGRKIKGNWLCRYYNTLRYSLELLVFVLSTTLHNVMFIFVVMSAVFKGENTIVQWFAQRLRK